MRGSVQSPAMTRNVFTLSTMLAASIVCAWAEPVFTDPFTADAKVPERRAVRGDWQIAEGIAKCTQDDALYEKYKNHGPIIFYDVPTTDATIRYAFRPAGCQAVVFTLNADKGHVFRVVTGARGTNFRAFPPNSGQKVHCDACGGRFDASRRRVDRSCGQY